MQQNTTNHEQKTPEKRKRGFPEGQLTVRRQKVVELVADHGLDPLQAYTLVNPDKKIPHPSTISRIKAKIPAWDISNRKVQKVAHTTLKKYAAGLPVGDVAPNPSAVLQAATRIIDQVSPVIKRTESLNVNATIEPVTLADYLVQR